MFWYFQPVITFYIDILTCLIHTISIFGTKYIWFCSTVYDLVNRYGNLGHKWPVYVSFVVITFRFFPHSWLITGFVTRVTRRVQHVEQKLFTSPEHRSLTVFSGVCFCLTPLSTVFHFSFIGVEETGGPWENHRPVASH